MDDKVARSIKTRVDRRIKEKMVKKARRYAERALQSTTAGGDLRGSLIMAVAWLPWLDTKLAFFDRYQTIIRGAHRIIREGREYARQNKAREQESQGLKKAA